MHLGAATPDPLAPKIAALHSLHAAGLPVPAGVILRSPDDADPARWTAIAGLLEHGPVIVRSALFEEDSERTAAAGLGTSIADCTDLAAVHTAVARITAALADDPWLRAHLGPTPRCQILVQRQILGPWLAVVAQGLTRHVEIHATTTHEALAAGTTPTLAAPLDLLPTDLRLLITPLCDRITAASPTTLHGLDLELVLDTHNTLWVVQARPLTRPLHPGWPTFAAAAAIDPATLPGLWTLDAEHNPAPLSPAHAGLILELATARPDLVSSRVLAGWLYEPTRPPSTSTASPSSALHDLQTVHIPAARAWLTTWTDRLTSEPLADLLPIAIDHLLAILTTYATFRAARSPLTPGTDLLCLRDRQAHLDVLPAAWDIASPPLADLPLPTLPNEHVPQDTSTIDDATLLRELDDHLFALGLAPLRRLYLRAATILGLDPTDIFLLAPTDLTAALRGQLDNLELPTRRSAHASQSDLFPPLQLLNGLPVPAPARTYLQGLAIGEPRTGPLHVRRDLADLLASPIPVGAILAMPALTAQAAVALHALHIEAVCCEHGGAMSHAALMARELGLSALIGCRGCTSLAPGVRVQLDTRTGRLRLIGA